MNQNPEFGFFPLEDPEVLRRYANKRIRFKVKIQRHDTGPKAWNDIIEGMGTLDVEIRPNNTGKVTLVTDPYRPTPHSQPIQVHLVMEPSWMQGLVPIKGNPQCHFY